MKSKIVCILTRPPTASLQFKGKGTNHTTVKWPIDTWAPTQLIRIFEWSCKYHEIYCGQKVNFSSLIVVLGGFYSDKVGHVSTSCKKCPNGSFVSLEKAPGKRAEDCKACPQGNSLIILQLAKVTECGRQRSKAHSCALRKFQVRDSQSTRDQITSDGRSKRAWSNWVLSIPFILSGSPNECDASVITTCRWGLRAPLVTCLKSWGAINIF